MTIHTIQPSGRRPEGRKVLVERDCGPAGCQVDWLASARLDADDDIEAFTRFSLERGWGGGFLGSGFAVIRRAADARHDVPCGSAGTRARRSACARAAFSAAASQSARAAARGADGPRRPTRATPGGCARERVVILR